MAGSGSTVSEEKKKKKALFGLISNKTQLKKRSAYFLKA